MDRRNFVYSLGALIATFAGACRRPEQKVYPAVNPIQTTTFGDYEYFDTALARRNDVQRLVIKTYDGKPIYITPNALPAASGSTNLLGELYNLYNPKRFFKPNIAIENCVKQIAEVIENNAASDNYIVFALDYKRSPALLSLIDETAKQKHNVIFYDFKELVDLSDTNSLPAVEALRAGGITAFIDCQNLIASGLHKHHKYLKNKLNSAKCYALGYYKLPGDLHSVCTLPKAHFLETWSDCLTLGGDYYIQQPIVRKLNSDAISSEELIFLISKELGCVTSENAETLYDYIKLNLGDEKLFEQAILSGVNGENIPNVRQIAPAKFFSESFDVYPDGKSDCLRLFPQRSPIIRSFEDYMNPFLREIKNPSTSIAFYNVLEINRLTAKNLQVSTGDFVKISAGGESAELPVAINDNLPDNALITNTEFGYAHEEYDGANINNIIYADFDCNPQINVSKTGKHRDIPYKFDEIRNKSTNFLINIKKIDKFTTYKKIQYLEHRYGLLVDLNLCNGCSACVVACRNENNIPIVGIENIEKSRDMNWLTIMSIDRKNIVKQTSQVIENKTGKVFIPYMCQHCENAPCEKACPVNASTHSPEGLSETIYNRCIGTRYCMAACQYKVRKFNFSNHFIDYPSELTAALNPKITVRGRGVVEKCSLCVQRINEFNSLNEEDKRGALPKTACMEVCPHEAIKLVDLNSESFREYLKINEEKLYQIVFGSANKPSVFYKLG